MLLNQSVLKEINPEYSLEGLKLKLQYRGHMMWRADSLEKTLMMGKTEGKWRNGQQRMRWLDSITYSIDMNLSKLWEIVEERGAWRAAVHVVTKNWTPFSNWTVEGLNITQNTEAIMLGKKKRLHKNNEDAALIKIITISQSEDNDKWWKKYL